jgi:glycosyltransferase involved in cell wall biosynthesis
VRVCLVLPELRPSGGVAIAMGHAARLRERAEFEVDVVALGEDAPREPYDVAIATWWETLPALLELDARRRVVLVQSAEERFYRPEESFERLGAALALTAPVHFVAVARWLENLVTALRPDARCWFVPNGIDKSLFAPREAPVAEDGPLRILIEGQHTLWFKGVGDALEAVSRMREPYEATLVALDPTDAPEQQGVEVIGGLTPDEMRAQYERHDVLLKLSRVEGLPLPLVEACHVGVPCVVAPFTGHDEVIRHGENGLVVGFDDTDGTAAALDLLARDRSLLQRLSAGAIESMSAWPSADQAAAAFATVLTEVAEAPEPDAASAAAAVWQRWRATAEVARTERAEVGLKIREQEASIEHLEQIVRWRDEELESLTSSSTYKLAQRMQRASHLLRRR